MILDGLATGLSSLTSSKWQCGRISGKLLSTRPDGREIGDQRIAMRQRPAHRRNGIKRSRHIAHPRALHQTQAIIVEPAQFHR